MVFNQADPTSLDLASFYATQRNIPLDHVVGITCPTSETVSREDYDTTIAKQDLIAASDRLIASSPASHEALILQLGDFFHMDSTTNATPASGNRLDVDTRFARVMTKKCESPLIVLTSVSWPFFVSLFW